MEIIAYQLFIIITIVATKSLKEEWVTTICVLWTIETIVLLFFPPLIIFQLFVIWGTRYYLLDDSKQPHVGVYDTASKQRKAAMAAYIREQFPELSSENKTPKTDEQENDNILLIFLTEICLGILIFTLILFYIIYL